MTTKEPVRVLGKISKAHFGAGGYQSAMFGASFIFQLQDSGGIGDFWGFWGDKRSEHAKWTEQDRVDYFGKMCVRIAELLAVAKVDYFDELVDVPVEVTLDGPMGRLLSWRVLTEVL